MKLNKHNKILIITTTFLALLGLIVIILLISRGDKTPEINPNENLTEASSFPQVEWLPIIKTPKEESGYQTVVNEYENYQITVPLEWYVEDRIIKGRGMAIFFTDEKFYESGLEHVAAGLTLAIVTFDNPKKLSITDWLRQSSDADLFQGSKFEKAQIGQYASFKTTLELTSEELEELEGVIPSQVTHLFKKEGTIYIVSCIAYSDADTLIPLCEKQIQTFEILR